MALLLPSRAFAHDVKGEILLLDIGEDVVAAELQIPITQLRADAPELFPGPDHDLASLRMDAVPEHVRPRLAAFSRSHEPFTTSVGPARRERADDAEMVVVDVTLRPPPGAGARWFELHDDVILDHVVTHTVYVFLRRDMRSGDMGESASLLGELHYQQRSLVVDRTEGGPASIVRHAFALGMHHIAEGADHVLFLFMLLLPAPLLARDERWSAEGTIRRAVLGCAKIITAFTIGHCLTLVGATLFRFSSGATLTKIVESAIAVSILVTAGHALRPIFPKREPLIAAAFGLVHGLAFASALAPFGFDGTTLALSLLGFNLGVEAMQLVIIGLTVPLLVLLSRGPSYRALRIGGAAFGAMAALGWIAERAFGVRPPTSVWVETLARRGPWILGALVLMIAVDALMRRTARS